MYFKDFKSFNREFKALALPENHVIDEGLGYQPAKKTHTKDGVTYHDSSHPHVGKKATLLASRGRYGFAGDFKGREGKIVSVRTIGGKNQYGAQFKGMQHPYLFHSHEIKIHEDINEGRDVSAGHGKMEPAHHSTHKNDGTADREFKTNLEEGRRGFWRSGDAQRRSLAAAHKSKKEAGRTVHLHALKKDGVESGMHDARKSFDSEDEAVKHHERIKALNPKKQISHHLYVNGKLVRSLS